MASYKEVLQRTQKPNYSQLGKKKKSLKIVDKLTIDSPSPTGPTDWG